MKKIILGCATLLLSLGLLAGCNKVDDIIEPGPVENPNSGENEGGGETYLVKLGASWEHEEGVPCWYYFTGELETLHNGVIEFTTTTEWDDAAWVTVTTLSEGVTLSFIHEGETQYLTFPDSGQIVFSGSEPYTWVYSEEYNGFMCYDTLDQVYRYLALDNASMEVRVVLPFQLPFGNVEVLLPLNEKPEA